MESRKSPILVAGDSGLDARPTLTMTSHQLYIYIHSNEMKFNSMPGSGS